MAHSTPDEVLEDWDVPDGYAQVRIRIQGEDKKYVTLDTYKDRSVEDVFSDITQPGSYQIQVLDGSGKVMKGGSRSFVVGKTNGNLGSIDSSDRFVAVRLVSEVTKWFQAELKAYPNSLRSLTKVIATTTKKEDRYIRRIDELEDKAKDLQIKLAEAGSGKWDAINKGIQAIIEAKDAKLENVIKILNEVPMDALIPGVKKMYKGMEKERRVKLIMSMFEQAIEEDTDLVINIIVTAYEKLKATGMIPP